MKKLILTLLLLCNFCLPSFALTHTLYDAFGYEVGHLLVTNDRYEIYSKMGSKVNSYSELLKYLPKIRQQFVKEYGIFSQTGRKIYSF